MKIKYTVVQILLPLRKIIFLCQWFYLSSGRWGPLSGLHPNLGSDCSHIDIALLLLILCELLVDGILEIKHSLVVDGKVAVVLGADDHGT